MEKSKRTIFIEFHNSNDKNDDIGSSMSKRHAGGETMTYNDYITSLEGGTPNNFDKNWKFNAVTGGV